MNENFRLFDVYRRQNTTANNPNAKYCDVDHLLRFWDEAKGAYLKPLFNDQLILERPIEYNRTSDELNKDMEDMVDQNDSLINALQQALLRGAGYTDKDMWHSTTDHRQAVVHWLYDSITKCYQLVENRVEMNTAIYYMEYPAYETFRGTKSYALDLNGKHIVIQEGQKLTRLWGQIANACGAEREWEAFRILHSQILNQKKLKGTLCLSIHPLDYATASDNENGWSSCMSWRESGCYRLGTVEMMNSPMVICAYVKSDKAHMIIKNEEWNSKKWRAWIIVTKDVILCNRHYPYHCDEFAVQAIEWVREMVGAKYGWQYDDVHTDFFHYMRTIDCEIEFVTNYMYNDLGSDDIIGCINKRHYNPGRVVFSGPAECMICGEEIDPGDQCADQLECTDCYAEHVCEFCGEVIDNDDVCYGPNGETMCRDCYEDRCSECSYCGETSWNDDIIEVNVPIDHEKALAFYNKASHEFKRMFTNWRGRPVFSDRVVDYYCMCDDCSQRWGVRWINGIDDYAVPDPNEVGMKEVFDNLRPRGYHVRYYGWESESDSTSLEKELEAFWTEQWEAFKKLYNDSVTRM